MNLKIIDLNAEISKLNVALASENLHKESLKRQVAEMKMHSSLTNDQNKVWTHPQMFLSIIFSIHFAVKNLNEQIELKNKEAKAIFEQKTTIENRFLLEIKDLAEKTEVLWLELNWVFNFSKLLWFSLVKVFEKQVKLLTDEKQNLLKEKITLNSTIDELREALKSTTKESQVRHEEQGQKLW